MVANEVSNNLNMLGMLMEDGIMGNLNNTLVTTIKTCETEGENLGCYSIGALTTLSSMR